jgi:hypothetical protein
MSNSEPWEAPGEKPIILKIKMTNWLWIGYTLRKGDESIGNEHWIAAGHQKERRPQKTLKCTILKGAEKCSKT